MLLSDILNMGSRCGSQSHIFKPGPQALRFFVGDELVQSAEHASYGVVMTEWAFVHPTQHCLQPPVQCIFSNPAAMSVATVVAALAVSTYLVV